MNIILKCKSLDAGNPLEIDINKELKLDLLESINEQLEDFAVAIIDLSKPIYIEKFHLKGFGGEVFSSLAVPKLSSGCTVKFVELFSVIQYLTAIVKSKFNDERELAIAKMCACLEINNTIELALKNIDDDIVSIVKMQNMSRSKAMKHFYEEKVHESIKSAVEAKLGAFTVDLIQASLTNKKEMDSFYLKHYQFHWLANSDFYFITAK